MNRRDLLGSALALPLLIQRALAGDLGPDIVVALREAHKAGRLLAIIVVDPTERSWNRGSVWGQFLTFADDATMARLGQCDWVCATPEAIQAALGVTGAAWVWIMAPGKPPQPGVPDLPPRPGMPTEAMQPALTPALDALERVIAETRTCEPGAVEQAQNVLAQSREVLATDPGSESDLLEFVKIEATDLRGACTASPPKSLGALDAAVAKAESILSLRREARRASLSDDVLDQWADARVAAMTTMLARLIPPATDRTLAARALASLRDGPPLGARWGFASGCGATFGPAPGVPEESSIMMCGMGHVSEKSVRFLDFLVK